MKGLKRLGKKGLKRLGEQRADSRRVIAGTPSVLWQAL